MYNGVPKKRSTILVVGAVASKELELRIAFRNDGYDVRFSGDGPCALELAQAWQPDLVVSAGSLPDCDAVVLCSSLRTHARPPDILIVCRNRSRYEELLDAGADDCVDLTCSLAELRARVRSRLRKVKFQPAVVLQ